MSRFPAPICLGCSRLRDNSLACDAYPEVIPQDILESKVDHRTPYAGDNGITFNPKTEVDAEYAASLFADKPKPD